MAMTTAQKPITEAEIRALVEARSDRYPADSIESKLEEAIEKAFDTIGYVTLDEQGQYDFGESFLSDTWADLRPSEQSALASAITNAMVRAAKRAREAIVEEVVAAALEFAEVYPDAPRVAPAARDRD
jgi:flavin-binding protein dodecin